MRVRLLTVSGVFLIASVWAPATPSQHPASAAAPATDYEADRRFGGLVRRKLAPPQADPESNP